MIKKWEAFIFLEDKLIDSEDSIQFEICSFFDHLKIEITFHKDVELSQLYLDLVFDHPIAYWRFLDYTWKKVGSETWVANVHSPKILQLSDGQKVVAKNTEGCWQYQPASNSLRWYFYHPMLTPTMVYDSTDKRHFLNSQKISPGKTITTGLLWTDKDVEEWGRTPLGFLPIVCFTDHSDFDTTKSLVKQRELFQKCKINVTKGFFLYNYTHKKENASYEADDSGKELICWKNEGHELAYHAFSQSYRGGISDKEFESFESPSALSPIRCYIDHGFHPYNYTQQELDNWNDWYLHIGKKNIQLIWNYIDTGVGHSLNGNQINPLGFTINKIYKASKISKSFGFSRNKKTYLKSVLLYSTGESFLLKLKFLNESLTRFRQNINISTAKNLLFDLMGVSKYALDPKFIFNSLLSRDKVFDVARFGPVFFPALNQTQTNIQVFQTLLVSDFDVVFSKFSLENFKAEKGVMIAHTYFGDYRQNHVGRLFENEELEIRNTAKEALKRLGNEIQNNEIWNPTISELYGFFQDFENLYYEFEDGNLVIKNFTGMTKFVEDV